MWKKAIAFILIINISSLCANPKKNIILKDKIIDTIDGVHSAMDRFKIENMLWLIQELRHMHSGAIKINAQGIPDPARTSVTKEFAFKGKQCSLSDLIEIENTKATLSDKEKQDLEKIFHDMKEYCEKVNHIILKDAEGTEQFMKRLIHEYCVKAERTDSLLLAWNKGSEIEMYQKTITSFQIFHTFSIDLMNFLAALIKSCPKAFKAYKDHVTLLSKGHQG